MRGSRDYLGDGLYVEYDGLQVRLFTSNGLSVTNEVFLEPGVLTNFLIWVKRLDAPEKSDDL